MAFGKQNAKKPKFRTKSRMAFGTRKELQMQANSRETLGGNSKKKSQTQ
jgi:hypothetical protein